MAAEARRRGAGHVRQLTILGDGAHWIWNLASQHFPEATQIVDLFHAREHLHDLGKLLAFMLGDQHGAWLADRLANSTPATSPRCCPPPAPSRWPGPRPRSWTPPWATSRPTPPGCATSTSAPGLFVGSGAVEAGCKAVIGQRLKFSGMHWSQPGATGILTLRCQQASGRWEEIWQQPPNRSGAA